MAPIASLSSSNATVAFDGSPSFDAGLCPCTQYDYINCGVLILCLLLVFYALALWDRWLTLKMRELRRSQGLSPKYGATSQSPPVTYVRTLKTSLAQNKPPMAAMDVTPNGLLAPPPRTL